MARKFVADEGGAYWLLDAIAICQRHEKAVSAEEFQVRKLKVNDDRTATLVCDDGNDNIVYTQHIHRESVRLSYGAIFGPDVADVSDWRRIAVEFVDGQKS